ncbi:unnamed protein product [Eruca vesicaria subsp. sativa]|uniref:Uncharacterized protein n=1 Tax=Eruca vesicaria subsp. sativa TaxID=29727 RepID=A0ABC8KEH9_ERUVS|nr:unnamed protein product [Eruca vesicaria subsp. sativa]
MDGVVELHDEIGRVTDRFYMAVLLDIFTRYCKRHSGLDTKDGGEHVAFQWAKEFSLLAHLCFLTVMIGIIQVPAVVERMRRVQPEADVKLGLGIIYMLVHVLVFLGSSSLVRTRSRRWCVKSSCHLIRIFLFFFWFKT